MASVDEVATQFLNHYYKSLSVDRAALGNFYTAESRVTWDKHEYKGQADIAGCFERIKATTLEILNVENERQVSPGNGIIILVTGHVRIDGGSLLPFTHVFLLMPTMTNSWYSKTEYSISLTLVC